MKLTNVSLEKYLGYYKESKHFETLEKNSFAL